ncbi:tRNA (guanine-N(7)-)-methyltransferase non-catalytic subunit trm82 [Elasticomyces elasticus]|uniref:tRNA (Guanine-N(7)-)-methyltransferase non-catalytic subunit trm82 n=1 Tax=Exophiala sideris TaxID=1016849 RepID=A0ABR0JSD9_9EURO|nr:tRNA (guanine-N(7)-)-methyltransferase non-catalytic subunit trm82 [Elasticomyces elasticus]KAK5039857.1 tRNA (guanine-N(7)-)-methyltransferase non-catalytic subunit trm82 [Exophiala sideris]KAK5041409.1 tRNA (guanine-N(7)-)-methyltransferase non-catalytic subunit trm82 [Exophiala sideris]KAK5068236.1 tRNA (guanine-N(7)-)-methyltransferase non-catalytic subunit trm82 [Exophiala sideris]KAK5187537.1 tRNA (guanine-N(7)-)-methyltransferase non-catalytic subunit trm82 [Eurotiomycetes sp. CCFEE 6
MEVEEAAEDNVPSDANGDGTRPSKRRRIDVEGQTGISRNDSEDSVEIISERKKGERRKPKVESSKLPNITHIITTSDAATVITVTAEDKSINVFSVGYGGVLTLQSQRPMPKRLCAIVLTPDQKNILVGDKFGDVYLLPLHPSNDWAPTKTDDEQKPTFTPSATELTVHTKGNLEALRQQREQKVTQAKKDGPKFELKLLLGHVSLLTDVAITEVQDGLKRKQYILTADRDEHIRVSRGITQAHVIEGYCLNHREFVTKLCIPPWDSEILVAGSGEPSLTAYRWRTGHLTDKETFKGAVGLDISTMLDNEERTEDRLVVANIWPVHYTVSGKSPYGRQPPHLLLVALEGLPVLLSYNLTDQGELQHHQTLQLGGNALDVAIGPALWEIVVSIDTVHKPGSMRDVGSEEVPKSDFFETFELFSNISKDAQGTDQPVESPAGRDLRWERSSLAMLLNDAVTVSDDIELPVEDLAKAKGTYSVLGEQLYGLENLRKKRGEQAIQGEEEAEEGAPVA